MSQKGSKPSVKTPPVKTWAPQWLELMRDGLMVVDEQWQVLFINQAMRTLSGELLEAGNHLTDLSGFDACRLLWSQWRDEVLGSGKPLNVAWRQAGDIVRRLFSPRTGVFVEFTLYALPMGEATALGVQITDVSERLGQTIREREARLELLQHKRVDSESAMDNRTFWETRFATEFRRSVRYDEPLSLLLIDVGATPLPAEAEPIVMREVAAVVRQALRESDIAGRFDRNLLAAVLPHTDAEGAADVARRLCERVSHLLIEWRDGSLQGRTAIGVIQRRGNAGTYTEMLQRADDALYEARNGAPNRYVVIE